MALQDSIIQRLRNAGAQVADVRGQLPRSGTWLRRPVSAIKILAGHHDAEPRPKDYDSLARYVGQARYHIQKDWGGGAHGDGLMYAWKVDNLGVIFVTRDLEDVLWSVGDQNYVTASYCFDGTTGEGCTREQIAAEQILLEVLAFQCPEFPASQANVMGHQEVPGNQTSCPGDFLQSIYDYRNTRNTKAENYTPNYGNPAPAPAPAPAPTPPPPPAPEPSVPASQPAPEPPIVPTPQLPAPGTVVQPEPGTGGGSTGQASGEVPVQTPPAANPVAEDLPLNWSEFQETFVPFKNAAGENEIRTVHLTTETSALDLAGIGAPIGLEVGPILSSGTLMDSGRKWYRGSKGGWYAWPAEYVAEEDHPDQATPPSLPKPPAWLASIGDFLRDPLGSIIRLIARLHA